MTGYLVRYLTARTLWRILLALFAIAAAWFGLDDLGR